MYLLHAGLWKSIEECIMEFFGDIVGVTESGIFPEIDAPLGGV